MNSCQFLLCSTELSGNQQRFCSDRCRWKEFNRNRTRAKLRHPAKCIRCRAPLTGMQQKFCSNVCNQIHSRPTRKRSLKQKAANYLGGQCRKCGYDKSLRALHFHHTGSKKHEVAGLFGRVKGWSTILREIKRCDLLCANCHAEEHAIRENPLSKEFCQYSPCAAILKKAGVNYCTKNCASKAAIHRRRKLRKEEAVSIMGSKCVDCGYTRCIDALQFHHSGAKTANIGTLIANNAPWKAILIELESCILVCGNCHAERHDIAIASG